jgi:hypothetical protein
LYPTYLSLQPDNPEFAVLVLTRVISPYENAVANAMMNTNPQDKRTPHGFPLLFLKTLWFFKNIPTPIMAPIIMEIAPNSPILPAVSVFTVTLGPTVVLVSSLGALNDVAFVFTLDIF